MQSSYCEEHNNLPLLPVKQYTLCAERKSPAADNTPHIHDHQHTREHRFKMGRTENVPQNKTSLGKKRLAWIWKRENVVIHLGKRKPMTSFT